MDVSEASWVGLWEKAKGLGPDPVLVGLSDVQVEREVRDGASRMAALTCRWLVHVAELVVRGVWVDDGARTPGQWLSWRCGTGAGTAREYVRVAVALRTAPLIRARFAAGTISYSKVRAITRVVAPQIEASLLDLADAAPAAQLERIIAGCRRQLSEQQRWADGPPDPPEQVRGFRRVEVGPDVVEYRVRMSAADAVAFDARVARLVEVAERDDKTDEQTGRQPPLPEDAGAEDGQADDGLADDGLADGGRPGEDDGGFVPVGVRRATAVCDAVAVAVADGPVDRSGADDHLVVVHVDADELIAAAGDVSAETAGMPAGPSGRAAPEPAPGDVSAETATPRADGPPRRGRVAARGRSMSLRRSVIARLACDTDLRVAGIARHRDGGAHPADIGRRSRQIPADLRRAVHLRDRHCRFPGCHRTRRLQAHHVRHWAAGGPTDLANLIAICTFHHRFIHDAGWSLRPIDPTAGRWSFHRPHDRTPHPPAPPLQPADTDTAAAIVTDPHPKALEPPWWEGTYDLSLTIAIVADEIRDLIPNIPDRGPHPLTTAA